MSSMVVALVGQPARQTAAGMAELQLGGPKERQRMPSTVWSLVATLVWASMKLPARKQSLGMVREEIEVRGGVGKLQARVLVEPRQTC